MSYGSSVRKREARERHEDLIKEVDSIIAVAGDDEMAHSMEDDLHRELINRYCPDWVKAEVKRLSEADFIGWCAGRIPTYQKS